MDPLQLEQQLEQQLEVPVGAVVGGIAGIVVGAASDFKLVGGKSLTDIAKDKLNNTVSSIRSNGFGKNFM